MTSIDLVGVCRDAAYARLTTRFPHLYVEQCAWLADVAATAYNHDSSSNAATIWEQVRGKRRAPRDTNDVRWNEICTLSVVLLVVKTMRDAADAAMSASEAQREEAQTLGSLAVLMQYGPLFHALGRLFESISGHEGKTPQEVVAMLRRDDALVETDPGTMADLVEAALECGLVSNEPGGGV